MKMINYISKIQNLKKEKKCEICLTKIFEITITLHAPLLSKPCKLFNEVQSYIFLSRLEEIMKTTIPTKQPPPKNQLGKTQV